MKISKMKMKWTSVSDCQWFLHTKVEEEYGKPSIKNYETVNAFSSFIYIYVITSYKLGLTL